MIDISKHRSMKYSLFGSLYFSEGLMIALTTVVTTLYLRQNDIPIPVTTLAVGIVNIPWILKFLWGPLIDHFLIYGRKPFIIIGGLLAAGSLFCVSIIDPGVWLLPFIFLVFLGHIGIGFIDVATDAWAIHVSTEDDRGKINGAMYTGQYGAWALGAAVLPIIASLYGYGFSYATVGLLILCILCFPLFVKENIPQSAKHSIIRLVCTEFKKKTTLLIALFAPLVFMNEGILSFIMPIYMRDSLELGDVSIGFISMVLPIFLACGSVCGGLTTDKIGRMKTLYLFIGMNIVFTASLIFTDTWWKLTIIYGSIGFIMGAHSTVSCALFMDATNPRIGATQYGIFTGVANLGLNGGGILAGSLVLLLGFSRTFLYAAWIFGPTLLLVYFIQMQKRKKLEKHQENT